MSDFSVKARLNILEKFHYINVAPASASSDRSPRLRATWAVKGWPFRRLRRFQNIFACEIRRYEYFYKVIVSFGDKESAKIFNLMFSRKIAPEIQERAFHKLVAIHEALSLENLRQPPSNHLELLRGKLAGFHSIRINKQWRVIFRWQGQDAHQVQITDYH